MAIESMTGFARAEMTSTQGLALVCEIRCVNGKALDARLKLPQNFERLELPLRQIVQKHITRGNMQISVAAQEAESSTQLVINEAFLERLLTLSKRLEVQHGLAKPSIGDLLSIRGVMENAASDAASDLEAPIFQVVEQALLQLKQSRAGEGKALIDVLSDQLVRIEALVEKASADGSRAPEAIRLRLLAQVKLIIDSTQGIDEHRLAMEAALLATKADICEELDRLTGHIIAARELLGGQGPVGRKLDFLAQEFNREVNTLCSKSNAASITTIGLELKAIVDQFREQVQNLE